MRHSIQNNVRNHGYAFVHEYCPGMDTLAVASSLGRTQTPWAGRLVQELIPRTTATPNTYSGIYGLNRFPFHTDLAHWRQPPRYLLLRCISGHDEVPTLMLDGRIIFGTVNLDTLKRAIFKPRRPTDGSFQLLRLCERKNDGFCLRWDEVFLKPASKIGEVAYQLVKEQLAESEHLAIALKRTGDILLIDNWRMLHARSPIPAGHESRKIERVYLESLH